jgi:phosphatidylinositol alpha-mannosyltransferase
MLQERHPDVQLDILGNGPQRAMLELLAEDLGAQNVNFLGFRDNEEKIRRFSEADLFCTPAIYGEGFGMVLLEAMATGVPLIAGDNPGYASVLTGTGALSLVNPRDTPDFARRLELLLYQKDLRTVWRKWAKAEVQQYDTKHMIDKYERLYEQELKRKKQ